MKTILLVILSILLVAGVAGETGCSSSPKSTDTTKIEYKNITPEDAKKRLDADKNIVLLDVRTAEEYAEKHIPGSMLIPVDVIETTVAQKIPDKQTTIFVYCRSGNRSVTASESLVKLGYTDVYNLGGIIDWPYEVE